MPTLRFSDLLPETHLFFYLTLYNCWLLRHWTCDDVDLRIPILTSLGQYWYSQVDITSCWMLQQLPIILLYNFSTQKSKNNNKILGNGLCFSQSWHFCFTLGFLSPRFFKKASGILQSPPPVRPSRYLLLNHWMKSNQIWCVSCSHEWGVQRHIFFFGPAPWGPGEGPKGQISLNIIKFQLQSQFQRFLNQTLCVFSHMKDIKHIRRDFHSAAWVMPQGSDFGVPWGVWGVKKKFFRISTRLGVWVTHMNGACTSTIFWVPAPWGLGEGPKGQISLNLNYKVIFKGF